MTYLKQLTSLMLIILCFSACSKDGPAGPAGLNGDKGKDGKDGKNGNANVVTGAFLLDNSKFNRDSWSIRSGNVVKSYAAKMANVAVPSLNEDVFRNGTVLVYMKIPAASAVTPDSWTPLPHTVSGGNQAYLVLTTYSYKVGMLQVYYVHQHTDNAAVGSVPSVLDATVPTQEYKYVVIAGNAAANSVNVPPVDYNDYTQVKEYFHLPD